MSKKELTPEQKKAMEMKYEIAKELGLLEKVKKNGMEGINEQRKRKNRRTNGKEK